MTDERAAMEVSLAGGASGADVPAGYKRTEAGVIPEDWEVASLGAIADIRNGATPSTRNAANWNGSIPWCTPTDVTNTPDKYLTETERRITEQGLAGCGASLLPAGALLLCSRATIGEIKIASSPVCTNQGFKSLVCTDRVHNEFLYYLLLTLKPRLIRQAVGSTFLEIGKHALASTQISFPPLKEQRAIAEALSDVDGLIESLEALIAKKRAVKTAAMQRFLTGRTRLPGFSGEWRTRQVLDVADVDPENLSNDTKPDFVFNYISLEQVVSGRLLGYSEEKFCTAPSRARRVLRYGDVLMSTVRPGLMAHLLYRDQIPNAICSTGFAVLRPKIQLCDPGFLFFHLLGHVINRQIQNALAGSNYPAISGRDVGRLEIPFPSRIQEQRAIAAALSDMDSEIVALERRLDKVRALKQGMMQQLLTGRIRLPATDGLAKGQVESGEGEPVGAAPRTGGEP